MLTVEQKKARKKGLGGSDIAAMLGVSPWRSPFQLWLDKTGQNDFVEDDNSAIQAGNYLEPAIREWYSDLTRNKVIEPDTIFDAEHGFLFANVDGLIVSDDPDEMPDKILEIKTADNRKRKEWGEAGSGDIPIYYLTQVMHYLSVTGCEEADVAVLFGGRDLQIFNVKRNQNVIDKITEKAVRFWKENVIGMVPPEPSIVDDLNAIFPKETAGMVPANDAVIGRIHRMREVNANMSALKKEKEALEFEIKESVGAHEGLYDARNDRVLCTWKASKKTNFDKKTFSLEHPAIFNNYISTTESRRLIVKK